MYKILDYKLLNHTLLQKNYRSPHPFYSSMHIIEESEACDLKTQRKKMHGMLQSKKWHTTFVCNNKPGLYHGICFEKFTKKNTSK